MAKTDLTPEVHRAPTQCALWTHPELVAKPANELFECLKTLSEDESPIGDVDRNLLQCRACGQLYLMEYYRLRSEWAHRTFIPVETQDIAEDLATRSVYDLLLVYPRLQHDRYETGKTSLRWATYTRPTQTARGWSAALGGVWRRMIGRSDG
jgi:hypothetical protein